VLLNKEADGTLFTFHSPSFVCDFKQTGKC